MRRRDLVGIGGSAGGIPALLELLEHFDPVEPASVFVVIHRGMESRYLRDILAGATRLEVCEPEDGETIRPNCIYLASTDAHMMIGDGHIHLRRGPRENNFRPAIDPLFRSLAVFGSSRTTGVVLSGYLDDGASGARAIMRSGGRILVQDPAHALSPDMPRATISAVGEPMAVLPAAELGKSLSRIVAEEAGPPVAAEDDIRLETLIAGMEKASMRSEDKLGELSPYNCPDCNGVLWQIEDGPTVRYRCHTGHGYTSRALDERQDVMLERSLFESLRACRERASFVRRQIERQPGHREFWEARARTYDRDCELLEDLIQNRGREPRAADPDLVG